MPDAGTVEGHINDLFCNSPFAGFLAVGKLEYSATGLTPEALALSRAKATSINCI